MTDSQSSVIVKVLRLDHCAGLELPSYQSIGASGMDLHAAVAYAEPITLAPGCRQSVPTGISISIPVGYEAQIRPRSGLALRHGITVLNAPGTIDSDYRGEVQALLINLGEHKFLINRGDRIAQMVVQRVEQVQLVEVDNLDATARSTSGFGSTGD
jgi:dUTP pyrophosphatase